MNQLQKVEIAQELLKIEDQELNSVIDTNSFLLHFLI